MTSKRIGKDLKITFDVLTNGVAGGLEGRSLVLELVHGRERRKVPFKVDGNRILFAYPGVEQRSSGVYGLTLWENYGREGQAVVDICSAFRLVDTTCMEGECSEGCETDTGRECIYLGIVNLEVGVRGASAYETWLKHGHEGTEEDFLAWLRRPASDAAEDALRVAQQGASDAVRIAEEAAGRTDASAGRADSAADNAETAIESISEKQKEIDAAESLRKQAEGGRVKAELERVSSETERVKAEQARVAAEQQRQSDTASAIRETVEAADRANTAADNADSAASGIAGELTKKQDSTDAGLQTEDKTIVGAINELVAAIRTINENMIVAVPFNESDIEELWKE